MKGGFFLSGSSYLTVWMAGAALLGYTTRSVAFSPTATSTNTRNWRPLASQPSLQPEKCYLKRKGTTSTLLFSPRASSNMFRLNSSGRSSHETTNSNKDLDPTSAAKVDVAQKKKNMEQPQKLRRDDEEEDDGDDDFVDGYIDVSIQNYFDGMKPDSAWNLATSNFRRQGETILQQASETLGISQRDPLMPPQCLGLVLTNEAVKQAEIRRESSGGRVDAHPVSRTLYDVGCCLLDNLFDGRPIQRFWFLEVIARIPYFSYVSMLHLYESFGWFRAVELRKVHAAEDWNELHHLLIMESLGGNSLWSDRFLGYHVAIFYYWALVAVYLFSPRIAYEFMALLEAHAVDTYTTFAQENKDRLQALPPPLVARSYYKTGDLYMFDDFQVSRPPGSRRPPCDTLFDVFTNISVDEGEHVKTMMACQDYAMTGAKVVSPHLLHPSSKNTADYETKRRMWQEWSDALNNNLPQEMDP